MHKTLSGQETQGHDAQVMKLERLQMLARWVVDHEDCAYVIRPDIVFLAAQKVGVTASRLELTASKLEITCLDLIIHTVVYH